PFCDPLEAVAPRPSYKLHFPLRPRPVELKRGVSRDAATDNRAGPNRPRIRGSRRTTRPILRPPERRWCQVRVQASTRNTAARIRGWRLAGFDGSPEREENRLAVLVQ